MDSVRAFWRKARRRNTAATTATAASDGPAPSPVRTPYVPRHAARDFAAMPVATSYRDSEAARIAAYVAARRNQPPTPSARSSIDTTSSDDRRARSLLSDDDAVSSAVTDATVTTATTALTATTATTATTAATATTATTATTSATTTYPPPIHIRGARPGPSGDWAPSPAARPLPDGPQKGPGSVVATTAQDVQPLVSSK